MYSHKTQIILYPQRINKTTGHSLDYHNTIQHIEKKTQCLVFMHVCMPLLVTLLNFCATMFDMTSVPLLKNHDQYQQNVSLCFEYLDGLKSFQLKTEVTIN
ncbi:hypothetical protein RIF29_30137 [Crotalaria pallida]|uniref:Uncharacterized protein n=1 Tax=Crotalaria pallida TaxID=3830 RepID=A0AAN9EI54_CROPI